MTHVLISTPFSHVNTSLQFLIRHVSMAHNWEVIQVLARASCSVRYLADALELGEAEISRSLRMMNDLGLVESHSIKKYHFYALADTVRMSMRENRALHLLIQWDAETSLAIELDVPSRLYSHSSETTASHPPSTI